jgi:hypothetical protein
VDVREGLGRGAESTARVPLAAPPERHRVLVIEDHVDVADSLRENSDAGKSEGSSAARLTRTSMPPVEAPITIMSRFTVKGCEANGTGRHARWFAPARLRVNEAARAAWSWSAAPE